MCTLLTLYGTPGCHLCEQAADLLSRYAAYAPVEIQHADILETHPDAEDLQRSIPFLEDPSGERLFWPFDAGTLHQWIQYRSTP